MAKPFAVHAPETCGVMMMFTKRLKKIRLRSATIRIADGKIKIRHIGGKRHCRIMEWEYLLQKDKDLIETLNKRSK